MGTTTPPKTTSPLLQLELVTAKKPRNIPPALLRRRKLSNKLWEQIQLANSKLNRTPFSVMHTFTIKDLEGNRKTIERPKRIKPWWFTTHDGQLCVSMFYGSKCLEIAPGKQAAQAKDLQHAVQILEIFKNEVEAGTFDAVIEKASGALRSCFDMKGKK